MIPPGHVLRYELLSKRLMRVLHRGDIVSGLNITSFDHGSYGAADCSL